MFFDSWASHRLTGIRAHLFILALLLPAQAMAGQALDQARKLFYQDRPEQALKLLKAIPDDAPDAISARLLRGVIQAELGLLDAAIGTFELLNRDFPQLPQPLNNLAVIYAERGMTEQARATLLRTIELHPQHANAHHNLGDLYIHMALDAYARAFELDPSNAKLTQKLAQVGNLAEAKEDYAQSSQARRAQRDPGPVVADRQGEPAPVMAEKQSPPAKVPAGDGRETNDIRVAAANPSPNPAPVEGKTAQPGPPEKTVPVPVRQTSTANADACLAVGPVKGSAKRKALSEWLKQQGIDSTVVEREIPSVIYQVYLPPTGNSAKTKRTIAQLKTKGVRVAAPIHTGVLRTGVSLGAFKTESRAQKLVRELKDKGIEAQTRTQNPVRKETWFALPKETDGDRLKALQSQFPKLRIETNYCK